MKQKLEAEKEKTDSLQHALAQSIPFKQALEDAISLHGQEKKALEATINDLADAPRGRKWSWKVCRKKITKEAAAATAISLSSPPLSGSSSGSSTRLLKRLRLSRRRRRRRRRAGKWSNTTRPARWNGRDPERRGQRSGGRRRHRRARRGRKSRFSRSWSSFRSSGNGSTTTTAAPPPPPLFDSLEESECDGVLLKKEKSKMTERGAGRRSTCSSRRRTWSTTRLVPANHLRVVVKTTTAQRAARATP